MLLRLKSVMELAELLNKMKILSLDLSTKTGWAVIEAIQSDVICKELRIIDFDTFQKSEKLINFEAFEFEDIGKVLSFIESLCINITNVFHKHSPKAIIIEQTNSGKYFGLIQKILEWIHYRVLITSLRLLDGKPPIYLASSEWRKIMDLRLTKEQKKHNKDIKSGIEKKKVTVKHLAVQKANELFNLNLKMKDNDKADAILLGTAYLKKNGYF